MTRLHVSIRALPYLAPVLLVGLRRVSAHEQHPKSSIACIQLKASGILFFHGQLRGSIGRPPMHQRSLNTRRHVPLTVRKQVSPARPK